MEEQTPDGEDPDGFVFVPVGYVVAEHIGIEKIVNSEGQFLHQLLNVVGESGVYFGWNVGVSHGLTQDYRSEEVLVGVMHHSNQHVRGHSNWRI